MQGLTTLTDETQARAEEHDAADEISHRVLANPQHRDLAQSRNMESAKLQNDGSSHPLRPAEEIEIVML